MTSRFLWQGAPNGLRDRWVDKPVQLIVFDSARAGLMGEHSAMDGTPTFAPTDAICTVLADPAFDHSSPSAEPLSSPAPTELLWTIDSTRAEYRTCGERRNGTRRVAGDERDQDRIWQTSCQGGARVARCVGTATDTTHVRAASALAGLEAAGSDVRKRHDASVL